MVKDLVPTAKSTSPMLVSLTSGLIPCTVLFNYASMVVQLLLTRFKDVRAKMFYSIDFFNFLLWSDNELLTCVRNAKKSWGDRLRFREKACGKLS